MEIVEYLPQNPPPKPVLVINPVPQTDVVRGIKLEQVHTLQDYIQFLQWQLRKTEQDIEGVQTNELKKTRQLPILQGKLLGLQQALKAVQRLQD